MAESKLSEVKGENLELKGKIKNLREGAERTVDSVTTAVLAAGTGAALGWMAQKNEDAPGEEKEYSGIKPSAAVAVLGHIMAITTKKQRYAESFRAVGNAALGVASFNFAKEKTKQWDEEDGDGSSDDTTKGRARRAAGGFRAFVSGAHRAAYGGEAAHAMARHAG